MASNSDNKFEKKIKKNNFFNLSSDESSDNDDDDDEKEKQEQAKIRKWDWDREENKDLYYTKKLEESTSKRLKTTNNNELKESQIDENHNKFRIEKVNDETAKYNLLGHDNSVNRIHWCQKNKNLLLASSMDSKISIWNINESFVNKPVQVFDKIHSRAIRNAIWSNQETEIVSVSYDQTSALINAETGKEINRLEYRKTILTAVANHPKDENIVMIGANNEILAWDIRTNKHSKAYQYKSAIGQIQDILFINENEFITCGDIVCKESGENAIIVWDYKSTAHISNQIFHEKYIATCLKKHPFNSIFLAQTHGNYIAEFSIRPPYRMNKCKRFESNGHATAGYSIGFDLNKNGSILASGSSDGRVYLYNFQSSKLIKRINLFNKFVTQSCMDVKFQSNSGEKQILAASSWNGLIKIFEI